MSSQPISEATIDYLPIWKKNATTCERLQELAEIARKHPDRFKKWVLIYCEENDDQTFIVRRMYPDGMRTFDVLGILDAGAKKIWQDTNHG